MTSPPVKKGDPGGSGNSLRSKTNTKGELQCFFRQSSGVKAVSKPAVLCNPPTRETDLDGESAGEISLVKPKVLDGKLVTVLVDTGSRMSICGAG